MTVGTAGAAADDLLDRLAQAAVLLGDLVQVEVPLAPLTTYRVGGPAALFTSPRTFEQLQQLAVVVEATGVPVPTWLFSAIALIAVANGALLTMIADTMIPEAVEGERGETGLLVTLGFLVAFALSHLGTAA